MHAATSKVENSAQGLSCKLKFVHGCIKKKSYKKVDGVVDEKVDEAEEERGVFVVDVLFGGLSEVKKP
jgi:hypothetical protein